MEESAVYVVSEEGVPVKANRNHDDVMRSGKGGRFAATTSSGLARSRNGDLVSSAFLFGPRLHSWPVSSLVDLRVPILTSRFTNTSLLMPVVTPIVGCDILLGFALLHGIRHD